ncbi:MAG: leucine-rich repeat domain-containing protein [Promethearchaeota archaeon]
MNLSQKEKSKLLDMWRRTDDIHLDRVNCNLFFENVSDFHHILKLKFVTTRVAHQPSRDKGSIFPRLTHLPPEIWELDSLEELKLTGNYLPKLPPEIGNLRSLQILDLSFITLSQVPPEIGNLPLLKELNLSNNALESLPSEISRLSQLENLYLSQNKLKTLPQSFSQLNSLKNIGLEKNCFTKIPQWLFHMPALKELWMVNNPIKEIDTIADNLPFSKVAVYVNGGSKIYYLPPILYSVDLPSFNVKNGKHFHAKRPAHRPIEDYIPALLKGHLCELYYDQIIEETSGEIKKMLLDKLPPDHALIKPLHQTLELMQKNSLPLQL